MGLKLENVSKKFVGKQAVDNISFEVNKPGVFGLLGTNGAGKTTTIRMLLGIIKKDTGEITWNNKKVERKSVNFGYLPEERGVYPKTKIYDQLMYFAKLKGMNQKDADTAIKIWNWMHRETPGEMHKIKQKKIQQDKIEKENLKIECQNKERIAKIDKINKAYAKNKKDDVIFTPKRRGRPRKVK